MMNPAKILVVEDEFLVAIQIESILTGAGWRVIGSAGTLASAVSLARRSACDAAVLDVNLRGERVDEVASILSERSIPFLFVSGYGRGNLPAAFRDGVEFLAKPFSDQMLVQTVGDLLRNRRLS
ncbi:MAG TPA: response regulator [Geobacterales bacterium]|nr:response regulator [Geobacterales bacterium]